MTTDETAKKITAVAPPLAEAGKVNNIPAGFNAARPCGQRSTTVLA
ncbi:MAG: hypothetical protein ACLSUF_03710 [Oscillospiraceae bacterium]